MNKKQFEAKPENERFGLTLEGECYFACVHAPNTAKVKHFNGVPEYSIKVVLEGDQLAKAEAMGLRIIEPDGYIPGKHVEISRKVNTPEDEDRVRPSVVDALQNDIPSSILIGNGSRVIVKFHTYWYMNNGGGVGGTLMKVQVKDLVPYSRKDRELEIFEDGFDVSSLLTNQPEPKSKDTETFKDDEIPNFTGGTDIFDD